MNKKINILLGVNVIIALFFIIVIPAFIREVWDLALFMAIISGIILIEIPIVFKIYMNREQ